MLVQSTQYRRRLTAPAPRRRRRGRLIAKALIVFFTVGTIISLVYTVRDMFGDDDDGGGGAGGGPVR